MAKILNITNEKNISGVRHIIKFQLENDKAAQYCEAAFLMPVREIYRMADLYVKGSILYLDTPDENATLKLGEMLKNSIEKL